MELALGAVAPVTPPVVLGVLLADDWVLLVCPLMLALELVLDGVVEALVELDGVDAEPLALGVELACALLLCPAMLPEVLLLDGDEEAFSEAAGLLDELEAELVASLVVALLPMLGEAGVEALDEALGDADCEALAPEAGGADVLDCEALALEFTLDPDASLELLGEALAVDAGAEDAAPLVDVLGELLAFAGLLLLLAELPAL